MSKKLSTEEFIEKAKKVHGDRYDYSKTVYEGTYKNLTITCKTHGDFLQTPNSHLNGCNCPMCRRDTRDDFIIKARSVHGWKYDYSKVEYVNSKTKVCIICPEHGEFWQTPHTHLLGRGCKFCFKEKKSKEMTLTKEQFIEKAKSVHGDKYDYSKVEYKNNKTKVRIICPEHGEFLQSPNAHINGSNCPSCVGAHRMTTNEFIEKAKSVHGDKYDYSKTEYKGVSNRIKIICPEHGEFSQLPQNHLKGCSCPKCGAKKNLSEKRLYSFLLSVFNENDIYVHYHDSKIWGFKSVDFYIKKYKIAIEHQGRQHFEPVAFSRKNKEVKSNYVKQQECDKEKLNESINNGVILLYFSYDKTVPDNYLSEKVYKNEEELLLRIKEEIKLQENDKNN